MAEWSERRSERRRSVFLRAKVVGLLDGHEMECSIQDTSRSGCKIISDNVDEIPEMVTLEICGLGERFFGKVVWRKDNMAGVEFHPRESDAAA